MNISNMFSSAPAVSLAPSLGRSFDLTGQSQSVDDFADLEFESALNSEMEGEVSDKEQQSPQEGEVEVSGEVVILDESAMITRAVTSLVDARRKESLVPRAQEAVESVEASSAPHQHVFGVENTGAGSESESERSSERTLARESKRTLARESERTLARESGSGRIITRESERIITSESTSDTGKIFLRQEGDTQAAVPRSGQVRTDGLVSAHANSSAPVAEPSGGLVAERGRAELDLRSEMTRAEVAAPASSLAATNGERSNRIDARAIRPESGIPIRAEMTRAEVVAPASSLAATDGERPIPLASQTIRPESGVPVRPEMTRVEVTDSKTSSLPSRSDANPQVPMGARAANLGASVDGMDSAVKATKTLKTIHSAASPTASPAVASESISPRADNSTQIDLKGALGSQAEADDLSEERQAIRRESEGPRARAAERMLAMDVKAADPVERFVGNPTARAFAQVSSSAGAGFQQAAQQESSDSSQKRDPRDAASEKTKSRALAGVADVSNTSSSASARGLAAPTLSTTTAGHVMQRLIESIQVLAQQTRRNDISFSLDLERGKQLKVSLRIVGDHVKSVFVTDSDSLRQAIRDNWDQLQRQFSSQGLEADAPDFGDAFRDGQFDRSQNQEKEEFEADQFRKKSFSSERKAAISNTVTGHSAASNRIDSQSSHPRVIRYA